MSDLVLTDIADGCASVILNRPAARNALSLELIEALADRIGTIERACETGTARVLILGGAERAF